MNTDEWKRLNNGPSAGETTGGAFLEKFRAHCAGNAPEVLSRCKEVMQIVLAQDVERWPTDEEWNSLLPDWFVAACADEQTLQEEMKRWFERPVEERIPDETSWTVGGWVYWFLPDERQWLWWDASVLDADTVEIVVQTCGDPFPWGSLDWLMKASGAIKTEGDY